MSNLYLGRNCYTNMDYTEEKQRKYPDHFLVIDNGASIKRPYFIHPRDVKEWTGKYGLKFYTHSEYKELRDE